MGKKSYKIIQNVTKLEESRIAKAAEWIVDNDCTDWDGKPLKGNHRNNILECTKLDLTNGACLMRTPYIVTGIIIGVAATATIALVINKFKDKE